MKLRPNQNIILEVAGEPYCQRYASTVDQYDEKQVIVTAPIQKEVLVPIRIKTEIIVEYTKVDVKEQGRYRISGIVTDRIKINNVAMLVIDLVGKWTKIQLRDYVRVNVSINGAINGRMNCLIKDLSGGGALCFSNDKYEVDSEITIEFEITNKIVQCDAVVVRCIKLDDGYQYGLRFLNIDEKTRKEIIQFVYQRQLDAHRKLRNTKPGEINDG